MKTVAQLIAELQKLPQDAPVLRMGYKENLVNLESPSVVVVEDKHSYNLFYFPQIKNGETIIVF